MDAAQRARLSEALQRLAEGDRDAFGPTYEILWPLLRAFCHRMLPPQDGDDAAQEALLKIFARASLFDPTRDPAPWALSIAAWECRTIRKRHARRRAVSLDAANAAEDGERTPEERVIDADLERALREVLGALEPSDRNTLRPTEASGSPEAVSLPTLRKRRARAVRRLRDAWRRIYGSG